MSEVAATYRVQLGRGGGDGTSLGELADLVPYLLDLGVSHAYLSPVLQAAPGSTHGYDVVDPTRLDERLGGELGWQALQRARGRLGLVLDVVPNHMGVAPPAANPWWWDVLRRGPASPYATWFDVDLTRGPVTLPYLPDPADGPAGYSAPLSSVRLVRGADGTSQIAWQGMRLPVAPGSDDGTTDDATAEDVAAVLDRQWYRLLPWRSGTARLTYRRFFDVSDLVAVRCELAEVFDATHARILSWLADGEVDGLRVDHVDGLRDPRGYLDRLRSRAPGAWVVVEKILEGDERLPASWSCDGTTGYEYLRVVGGLFVDPAGADPLARLDVEVTGASVATGADDWAETLADAKRYAATSIVASELHRLALLAPDVPDAEAALAELMAAFPVYRTYLPGADAEEDVAARDVLRDALAVAQRRRPDLAAALDALAPRLLDADDELCLRLQQTTGMVMAKGVEDTAFYRHTRLVALGEVGGDPEEFGVPPAEFFAACTWIEGNRPRTMTSLSTHDTKRSEDVRARLAVLSELPEEWAVTVRRWTALLPAPDARLGYFVMQTLVGAWPLTADRLLPYVTKASREAKRRTSWTSADPAYDEDMRAWASAWVTEPVLVAEVADWVRRIRPYACANSLGQKLLQLTMPGVPDVYQGTELWDLSLVDPDNRRSVDVALRRDLLARLDAGWVPSAEEPNGAAKLLVVSRALRLRRDNPELFGPTRCVTAVGPAAAHLVAMRRGDVVALATRLPVGLGRRGGWGSTVLRPGAGTWRCALTGRTVDLAADTDDLAVSEVLERLPVALLVRAGP